MLQPSSSSPYKSRRFDTADEPASQRRAGPDRSGGSQAESSLPPGLIAVAAAARREESKRRWPSILIGIAAFTVAVLVMQWVMPSGGSSTKPTKSFMPSILKDVGHVIGTRKGPGIER